MTVFGLLAVGIFMKLVMVIFMLCALVLILVILIQKGKGGGLSGAFGGGMASGILGSKTGDFLTWFTIVLVGLFLSLAVVMAKYYKPTISDFGSQQSKQTVLPAEQSQVPEQPVVPVSADADTDANSPGLK